ncbi:flagellar type III secretion system pore protein FliP [Burkholderia gladioli]|uniref:flagellar type III secretion system pore protein FliP n=1 Tax=Burkholderia gladioli TaxID=28095 RepID=UPI001FC84AC3|nr:flagellar type III secretion system pore protein FliP [Burkholderia gladioli]
MRATPYRFSAIAALALLVLLACMTGPAHAAAPISAQDIASLARPAGGMSEAVRIATLLTVLSVLPAFVVSMTAFIRISIVLSMIRHAFGMPETPPTPVLISLALFLTLFAMLPTFQAINHEALQPFMSGHLDLAQALERSSGPLRHFMLRQVREDELKWMYEVSHEPLPATPDDVSLLQLTPAFILNELRVSFQIGFVILLPFLLIDLIVSSVLLSLGMLMVPPATISLPLKVLMFVLVDGWGLILRGVLGGFK